MCERLEHAGALPMLRVERDPYRVGIEEPLVVCLPRGARVDDPSAAPIDIRWTNAGMTVRGGERGQELAMEDRIPSWGEEAAR